MLKFTPEIPKLKSEVYEVVNADNGHVLGTISLRTVWDTEHGSNRKVPKFTFKPSMEHEWHLGEYSMAMIVKAINHLNQLHNL